MWLFALLMLPLNNPNPVSPTPEPTSQAIVSPAPTPNTALPAAADTLPVTIVTSIPTSTVTLAPTATPTPEDPFPKYFADYQYQIKLYQEAYKLYTEKKQINLKYGTVTTQKEIFDATKQVLAARNDTLRTYALALQFYIDKLKSQQPQEIEKSQIELTAWEKWLKEQNLILESINNADDLKDYLAEFKKNYIGIQKSLYSALVKNRINYQKLNLQRLSIIEQDLKSLPDIPASELAWFDPVTVKIDLINQAFSQSLSYTNQKQNQRSFDNFYPDSTLELTKVDNYLLDISKTLKSIIIKFTKPNG
ncbi:MAG: hypothetical protein WC686_04515 [Candidatus Shapirobacteria bacterium]|jgi:hypothetical protein